MPSGSIGPIPTDELTRLIERDVSDFDPGADLSEYAADVEGVTEFSPRRKPRVRTALELAYDERRENRYRRIRARAFSQLPIRDGTPLTGSV
jgi:hypothetical protein